MCCVVHVQSTFEKAHSSKQHCGVSEPALLRAALKPYQSSSVAWMSDIEHQCAGVVAGEHRCAGTGTGTGEQQCADAVAGEWLCSHVMKYQSAPSSLLFDVFNNRILCESLTSPNNRLANFTVQVKGGILAGMTSPLLFANAKLQQNVNRNLTAL